MNSLTKLLVLSAICIAVIALTAELAFAADPGADAATCAISVTVDSIIEWEGANFPAIALDSQESTLDSQADSPQGSAVYTLWTNCNLTLSSDQTTASQLYHNRGGGATEDTLVTKYTISTDEAGVTATGAEDAAVAASGSSTLTVHSSFLSTALAITHFNTDGAVEITLGVEATNDADNVADSGAYAAVQTITTAWVSDN